MSNITVTDEILNELNDEKARTLIPAMVFCALLMAIGTLGNILVVFFYGFKSKTTSATCFILALAIFDLVACLFGIPIEITDMRLFYLFKSVTACRLLVFVNHFAVIASAFTLCFIAIDRYRRICKPFDKQMSVKRARIICGICAGLGVILGWPSVALYTVEKVDIATIYNNEPVVITGYDCTSVKAEVYSPYLWTYSVIQFVGFLGITTALIVCYFLVGRQLFKHKKFRFYVAQNGLRRTASGTVTTMTTSNTEYSSDNAVTSIPIAAIPEEDEEELEEVEYEGPDDDPPMMQESIPDLRELLELDAKGLTDVDEDRPPSAIRDILGGSAPNSSRLSRPSSILTDVSLRSKGSIMTVRSVIICDESENQIFDIEPRDKNAIPHWRPRSALSDSTWSNSITRPGSACSINTISRPPSITSIHSLTEVESNNNSQTKTHSLGGSDPVRAPKELKRTRSEGFVESRPVRRTGSNRSIGKTGGIRRTLSEGSGLKRTGSNTSTSSRLRRTGSTESSKMNTDTDTLKDMRMKMLDINTIKYTFIMIVIAVVFVCSCVPYLGLAVWRVYAHENLVYEFNDVQQVLFQIGIRSYFLNCAINPFIYGFFNSQFRAYFYKACCSCCDARDQVSDAD
ncbi:uncharacterized protein LOC132716012 [Ruditapes philippinarum]|uniref:uncharacterized protein LOC132716012 n=1 Tax=Ruditapes philippinarum TaxID=129788 RepID=UPI00295B5ADD|nr:uncharacterized protein LOC132716012 [Ruditapes philippinarum]